MINFTAKVVIHRAQTAYELTGISKTILVDWRLALDIADLIRGNGIDHSSVEKPSCTFR